jgi:hypothetical protein
MILGLLIYFWLPAGISCKGVKEVESQWNIHCCTQVAILKCFASRPVFHSLFLNANYLHVF